MCDAVDGDDCFEPFSKHRADKLCEYLNYAAQVVKPAAAEHPQEEQRLAEERLWCLAVSQEGAEIAHRITAKVLELRTAQPAPSDAEPEESNWPEWRWLQELQEYASTYYHVSLGPTPTGVDDEARGKRLAELEARLLVGLTRAKPLIEPRTLPEGQERIEVTALLHEVAWGLYENFDPELCGDFEDGGRPAWADLTEAQQEWFRQCVIDCVVCNREDPDPDDDKLTDRIRKERFTEIALLRSPAASVHPSSAPAEPQEDMPK